MEHAKLAMYHEWRNDVQALITSLIETGLNHHRTVSQLNTTLAENITMDPDEMVETTRLMAYHATAYAEKMALLTQQIEVRDKIDIEIDRLRDKIFKEQ